MNLWQILQILAAFSDPENPEQLQSLDAAVGQLDAQPPLMAVEAMLRVWERFPESDGYGVFWSLLHAIECAPGYEVEVVQSLARQPNEFNLRLVSRMRNAGLTQVGGRSLVAVLESIAGDERASAEVRREAMEILEWPGE